MTITLLFMGGILTAFIAIGRGMNISMAHTTESGKLNYAIARISRTLRPISEVHYAGSDYFEFTTTDMEGNDERIRLYYNNQTQELIEKSITDNEELVILEDVQTAKFNYFDRHGDTTNTLIDMNAVQFEVQTLRTETTDTETVTTETAIFTFRNRTI